MESARPYWMEPLVSDFEVKIIRVEKKDNVFYVHIDKDVIRPEGGGQAGERGTINDVVILNTMTHEGQPVIVTNKAPTEGDKVQLHIDMDWRRSTMRNHTAEHLLVSQLLAINETIKLGYIWVDGEQGTVDIEGGIEFDEIIEAENKVQEIIFEDIPVHTKFISSEKLKDSVRAREGLNEKHTILRVVSIEGIDDSACSGIHAQTTGDIGFFKITDIKPIDGGVRIQFHTHAKAASMVRSIYNELLKRKSLYPYEIEQIGAVLDKAKRAQEDREEMMNLIVHLLSQTKDYPIIGNYTFIHYYLQGFAAKDLRILIKSIPIIEPSCILLFAPGEKSSFLFWTHGMPQDAKNYIQPITEAFGGKGGGSKQSFTGGFTEIEDPQQLYEKIIQQLKRVLKSES